MKSLRIRFAIGFSLLFTIFLAIALLIVYISYADFKNEEFYKRLKDRALTTFRLLIEVEQVDHDLLKVIDKNTLNSLYNEKVLIFEDTNLIYSSIDDKKISYDSRLLQQAKKEKEIFKSHDDNDLLVLTIKSGNKEYVLLVAAFDKYGRRKMLFLRWVMITVYCAGLVIGWTATFFFVKKVIKPLEILKNNIQNINSANLDIRLQESDQGEEVDSLATNFNQMLERLQQSFNIQKNFVHYASHELRTPLTVMIGITENALGKKLNPSQHEHVLEQLFQHQVNLSEITNSLLLLSDNKIVNEKKYPHLRLDELLFRSVDIVQNLFADAKIAVNIEAIDETEEALMVFANEPLLLIAFNNLLKNALLYSKDNQAMVTVRILNKNTQVEFRNIGDSFPAEEEAMLFTPFYRGSNATTKKGHGLGLSLVKQVVEMHNATISYHRDTPFNVFILSFQNRLTANF
jgi:two-component system, OmpR family, sensor histidine kinase ArlS